MGLNITVHGFEQLYLKYKFRLSGRYLRLSDSMTKSNKICYDKYAITTVGVSGLKEKKTKNQHVKSHVSLWGMTLYHW
ncbi:MAG: hypothetical protein HDT30_09560 [Clostridiales bacterium]|nr:hypothetical protein [Clostridiales bacterium]